MDKQALLEARKLIAGFLKEKRIELGISQEELANLCEVKRLTIIRIESGKFMPNMELFLKMTHHLNCYFFLESKEADSDNAKMMRERWGKINNN